MLTSEDKTPYRTAAMVPQAKAPRVTKAARRWVRFLRLFSSTLAARRYQWRADRRFAERYDAGEIKTGVERVVVTDANGLVIGNRYVDHGRLRWQAHAILEVHSLKVRGDRRYLARMPRT